MAERGKAVRKLSEKSLENVALFYLQRFASSVDQLRKVLVRRADRALRVHGGERAEALAWVESLLAKLQRSGLLDDHRYAQATAASLLRRGRSVRQIQMRLRARGVSAEEVAAGIAEVTEASAGSPDAAAALAFARRKRLGPFRRAPADEQRRAKELASLARAGFSYGLAKRVVNADSVEQLEADMLHSRFSVEPDPETP